MKRKQKLTLYLVLLIAFSLGIYFLGSRVDQTKLAIFIESTGIFAPLVYILLMATTYIFAPLSGTPVLLVGFVLFTKKVIFLTYLAGILSMITNFWIARIWGREMVQKLAGAKNMERVDKFTQNYGVKSLIFLRFFQGTFQDFISYAYGLTNIKFAPYIAVSVLVPIPWLLIWQFYILDRVNNVKEFTLWLGAILIPFWAISLFFLSKIIKNK